MLLQHFGVIPVPKQLIYIIDAYKLASVTIGILLVMSLGIAFLRNVTHAYATPRTTEYLAAPYETYPRGKNSIPAVQAAMALSGSDPAWPLHGKITTEFGEPHSPWQRTHTGIDISSGQRAGVAPVVAFRSGTVSKTVRSYSGYGNHVVIDHGNGLSSLYGHLASIAVSEGQVVKAGDTVGYEGSTGASTGTHLHFEVLLHGQPINPHGQVLGTP